MLSFNVTTQPFQPLKEATDTKCLMDDKECYGGQKYRCSSLKFCVKKRTFAQ